MQFGSTGLQVNMSDPSFIRRINEAERLAHVSVKGGITQESAPFGMPDGLWNFFSTTADLMSRWNYGVAGFMDTVQGTGEEGENPFARFGREVFSGVGGLQGDKEAFGDVLEQAGVGDISVSQILTGQDRDWIFDPGLRGIAGFSIDVATDPLSWVSQPAGMLGKGMKVLTGTGITRTLNGRGMTLMNKMVDGEIEAARKFYNLGKGYGRQKILAKIAKDERWFDGMVERGFGRPTKLKGLNTIEEGVDRGAAGALQVEDRLFEMAGQRILKEGGESVLEKEGLRFRPFRIGNFDPLGIDVPVYVDDALAKMYNATMKTVEAGVKKMFPDNGFVNALGKGHNATLDFMNDLFFVNSRLSRKDPYYVARDSRRRTMLNAAKGRADQYSNRVFKGLKSMKLSEEDNKVFHMFLAEDVEGTLPKLPAIKKFINEYSELASAANVMAEKSGLSVQGHIWELLQNSPFFSEQGITEVKALMDNLERMSYFNANWGKFNKIKHGLSDNHKLFKSEMNYQQMLRRIRRSHEAMGDVEVRAKFLDSDVVVKGGRYWPRDHSLLSEEDKRVIYNNVRDKKLVQSNVGSYYEDRRAYNHWGYVKGMERAGYGHRVNWDVEEVFGNRMKTHYQQMINRDFVEDMVIRYGAKSELMRNAKVASIAEEIAQAKMRGTIDPEDISVAEDILDSIGNNDLRSIKEMILEDLDGMGTFDDTSIEKAVNRAVQMVMGSREVGESGLEATRRTIAGNIRGVLRDASNAHRDVARMVVDNNLLDFQPGEIMDVVRNATPERMTELFGDFRELQLLTRVLNDPDPQKFMDFIGNTKVKQGPITRSIIERAEMLARREGTLAIDPGPPKPVAKPKAKAKPKSKPKAKAQPAQAGDRIQLPPKPRSFVGMKEHLDILKDKYSGDTLAGAMLDVRKSYQEEGISDDVIDAAFAGEYDNVRVGQKPGKTWKTRKAKDREEAQRIQDEYGSGSSNENRWERPEDISKKASETLRNQLGGFKSANGHVTFEQVSRAFDEIMVETGVGVAQEARDLTRMVLSAHKVLKTDPKLRNIPTDVQEQAFHVALRETLGALPLDKLPKNQQDFITHLLGMDGDEWAVTSMAEMLMATRRNKKLGIWSMMRQMDRMFEGNEELLDAFMKGDLPEESLSAAMEEVMKVLKVASNPDENMGAFNFMAEVARLQMRFAENVDDIMTVRARHAYSDALDTIFHDMDVLAREQRIKSGRDANELNAMFRRLGWHGDADGIYDFAKAREFNARWEKLNENQQKVIVAELTKSANTFEDSSTLFSFLDDVEWFKKMEISDDAVDAAASVPAFTQKLSKGNKTLTLQTSQGKLAVDLPDYLVDDMQRQLTASIHDPQLANFLKFVVWGNNVFKANVTRYFPSFNMRNIGSNFVQSIADAGFAILNPRLWKSAFHVIRGDFDSAARLKNGLRLNELAREMDAAGLITDPDLWTEVGKGGLNLPTDMPKWLLDKTAAWRKGKFGSGFLDKLGTLHKIPSFAESHARILHYLALREGGMGAQQALEHVNRFLFDYALLTGAEKKAFKNIFPFYTWTRKNIELQFRLLREKPFVASVQTKAFADRDRPESASLPDYLRGEFPVRLFSRDDKVQFLSGLDIPLRNMDAVWAGSVGQTFREHVNLMTPLIKYPVEFFYGKDTFGEETRGHGRVRERIGAAIERRYPKKMKDWLDFEVQTMPDGRKQYFLDRTMLFMLNKALFMSRWSNESLRVEEFATEFGQGNTEQGAIKLTKFLTGLSYREFDFTEAQRRSVYNNSSRLMDLLSNRGWMREFTTKYWSPEARGVLHGQGAQ